ncbi:MAG TPA: right-handed parallel beta-helix repeat-containing protein [Thermoanaerobaculia bacterium]|nr:right-handed parallel beta-helix repeat-containing protein [Thermoanaerobaculia bacterium]
MRKRLVALAVLPALMPLAPVLAQAPATYPWPVFTGAVVAVPPSSTGLTYYVDGAGGDDAHDGLSLANAFKTVAHAVSVVAAGDTVLIRAGLYREGIDLVSAPSGTAAKPITFGSFGDGEVILDGSAKVSGWVRHAGNVWKAPVAAFTPSAVVVNETPLREVSHGQTSTAPSVGLAGVTAGSGAWFYDTVAHVLYADMTTTLGAGDPSLADIVVPNSDGAQAHVYFYLGDYYTFKGLTIRGSGSSGVWGYGNHVTVESCNIKFNGKGAVSFQGPPGNTDNAVLTSHIYHNVLINWPRGNNDYVGGGWPSGLGWYASLRPLARGNIVHKNGGEGILTYGTEAGSPSGAALFEQNVVYDNWSVNLYIDNQPDGVIRKNFVFDHPRNLSDLLYQGTSYWTDDVARKLTPVGVMLADEEWSSDATNNHANLDHTTVADNVLAGNRVAIRDYAEGPNSEDWHGLKNTVIANNTIVLPAQASPDYNAGIEIQDNMAPSGVNRNTNSRIENNVVYGFNTDLLIWSRQGAGLAGITMNGNVYFSAYATPFGSGVPATGASFAAWKSAHPGFDTSSLWQDPLLLGVGQFAATAQTVPVYDWRNAVPSGASPAKAIGASFSPLFTDDFTGTARPAGAYDSGAFVVPSCPAEAIPPIVTAPPAMTTTQTTCP